ncbi:MAG: nicotinate phosphoribosyltransferase [Cirrosporium novae-zelandiae]|nr:MAG: nicotinate phosphoribosyltransferase [Cirrosporium novae-zelandiae]
MAETNGAGASALPDGIFTLLDTDLYKLTMQCAVLKYFPDKEVAYALNNRTPNLRLTREAFGWLKGQIHKLGNITVTPEELDYLRESCSYFSDAYLRFLTTFRLRPSEQVEISFKPLKDTGGLNDFGDVELHVKGLWVDTIFYEIPLLALTSEAFFKFCDKDWTYDGQQEKAYQKGITLLEHGCALSEFGSRRRRDYHTQDLVMKGLCQAQKEANQKKWKGVFTGTSNVHFAMKYHVKPVGTVAHEWFMGIAAATNNYEGANETGLRYWLGCFGEGVLGIALTDTFGTPDFLKAFGKPIPRYTSAATGAAASIPSTGTSVMTETTGNLSNIRPPIEAPIVDSIESNAGEKTYAEVFTGVRQDSGDPVKFIRLMREFYNSQNIKDKKTIVFSDSLNIERTLEYKKAAEEANFETSFGIGTFLTNDFQRISDSQKSVPMNIVIKLSSAGGRPAIKISDNKGKNTGDQAIVEEVKARLGYIEKDWKNGDESKRYGQQNPYAQNGSAPYDQQGGNPYAQQDRDQYGASNNLEMQPVNGQQTKDPNAILNECRDIDKGVDTIQRNLDSLRQLQQRSLDDPEASQGTATNRQLDALNTETMNLYRAFADRIKKIKQSPESGDPRNAPQVGKVDRKLKTAINQYQQVERDFRRRLQSQMERQYRIVRPDASDAEVQEACEDTSNNQVFSQALLQSDRRGQAQSALRAVQGRHEAIQKIEQQMIELAQLFQDMEALVVQQEPAVAQIEQRGEEVNENVAKGNIELNGAIEKARARNRKKWWCLGISSEYLLSKCEYNFMDTNGVEI